MRWYCFTGGIVFRQIEFWMQKCRMPITTIFRSCLDMVLTKTWRLTKQAYPFWKLFMLHCSIFFFKPGGSLPIWALAETCLIKELFFFNKGFSSINHIPGGDDDLFINRVATKTIPPLLSIMGRTLSEPETTWSAWQKKIQALHHVKIL